MADLEKLAEFLAHGELVDVRTLSFSAEKLDEPRENFEEDDVEQNMTIQVGYGGGAIEVRLHATVLTFSAEYTAIVATQFRPSPESEVTEELAQDFATEVGVMTVYPYLRELVQSSSVRISERPLTIPLIKRGEVQLDRLEGTEKAQPTSD